MWIYFGAWSFSLANLRPSLGPTINLCFSYFLLTGFLGCYLAYSDKRFFIPNGKCLYISLGQLK